MGNKVKFKKGTLDAYNTALIDDNTLYAIPGTGDTSGRIYLGSHKIGEELKPANNNRLGGVKAIAKTTSHTEEVAVDVNGKLFVKPSGSSIQQPIPIMNASTVGGGKAIAKNTAYTEKIAVAPDGTLYSKATPIMNANTIGGGKANPVNLTLPIPFPNAKYEKVCVNNNGQLIAEKTIMTNTIPGVAKAKIADGTENKLVAINKNGELCYKESTGTGGGTVRLYHTTFTSNNPLVIHSTSWTEVLRINGLQNGTYLVNFIGQMRNTSNANWHCYVDMGYRQNNVTYTRGRRGNAFLLNTSTGPSNLNGVNVINFTKIIKVSSNNPAQNFISIHMTTDTNTSSEGKITLVHSFPDPLVQGGGTVLVDCTQLTCLLITDPIAYPASSSSEESGERT